VQATLLLPLLTLLVLLTLLLALLLLLLPGAWRNIIYGVCGQ
jgi:hypothetical protein